MKEKEEARLQDIENKKNEVVDLKMFVEIFEKIYYNLSCLAKHYEEIAMFVPE